MAAGKSRRINRQYKNRIRNWRALLDGLGELCFKVRLGAVV